MRYRYCALHTCLLLKIGPWRGLPAAFQILFELIAASFSAVRNIKLGARV